MTDIVEFWGARPVWFRLPEETRQTVFGQIQARLAARSRQGGPRFSAHRCPGHDPGCGEIAVVGFSNGRPGVWHRPAVIPADELLSHYFEKLAFVWGEKSAESYVERLRGGGRG